ncbi:MAG TPA: hypothetical protein QGF58_18395 [Myxococcota bacterium]|nr:hypothetical protein [Myxococcota bacterium]
MKRRSFVVSLVAGSALAAWSPRAHALDLVSSSMASTGGALGIVGIVLVGTAKGDESQKTTGRVFIIAGFAASGAFLVSSTVLNMLALAVYSDEIEALELEAAAGHGPMLDSLAAGFDLSPAEVAEAVGAARAHVPALQDNEAFSHALLAELSLRTELTQDRARPIVQLLAEERGFSDMPGHRELSRITGVPIAALASLTDRVIGGHLEASAVAGEIRSARAILNRDSLVVLDRVIDSILDEHGEEVHHWMLLQAEAARARGIVP